ncbi:MAG: DNA-3-methyladenine glycosylase 2 family protein [Candidatus Aenigmarchaeota archaeon]|nr:DNA-3-methyladenine glycosylase 2 family protein [Candidatus Aenigmarchaeota archaeon]
MVLLNLGLTMKSGQTPEFLWNCEEGRFSRLIGGRLCEIWHDGELKFTHGFESRVMELLRKDDDLERIYKRINTDGLMGEAIKNYRGLRITKSDPWETTLSFICSINNNIKRIRKNVQSLTVNGAVMTPEEILNTDISFARLGFRQKFLKKTAEMIIGGHSISEVNKMKYEEAVEHLTKLHGIGDKVANCVLLFGYGFLESFPIDTWIRKIMTENYFDCKKTSDRKIREFAQERWGKYAGYANQYLFCYSRGL